MVASMPVLAASSPMSVATASICAATVSGGSVCTPVTPTVFCTVTAVTATQPCTPHAVERPQVRGHARAAAGVRARDRHDPRRGRRRPSAHPSPAAVRGRFAQPADAARDGSRVSGRPPPMLECGHGVDR